jgi:hypothetical protein
MKVGDLVVSMRSCRNNSTKFNTGIIIKLSTQYCHGSRWITVMFLNSEKSVLLQKDLRMLNESR